MLATAGSGAFAFILPGFDRNVKYGRAFCPPKRAASATCLTGYGICIKITSVSNSIGFRENAAHYTGAQDGYGVPPFLPSGSAGSLVSAAPAAQKKERAL